MKVGIAMCRAIARMTRLRRAGLGGYKGAYPNAGSTTDVALLELLATTVRTTSL